MILPALAAATSAFASCDAGVWNLKAGNETIFRLDVKQTPSGATATWERPEHFDFDGDRFSHIRGPAIRRQARSVRLADEDVEVKFDDPTPGATPDVFRLKCIKANHIAVTYEGTPFEPFDFVKGSTTSPSLGPWDVDRRYVLSIVRPTNPEMTEIFNADQADRAGDKIDWSVVSPADKRRRARTEQLLDAGSLQSGDDYSNAAFVFQHGDTADDYLKAHLLAMIAVARGNKGAIWIASATLDRYLQMISKPQVLGTQFEVPNEGSVTQEPYNRTLVSDAMRKALHVPSLAEQRDQAREYQRQAQVTNKPAH